jgi:hypothetical protein
MDTDEGRPLARSEDKYRRVCWKLIHHHAYRTRPLLTSATLPLSTSSLNIEHNSKKAKPATNYKNTRTRQTVGSLNFNKLPFKHH